MLCRKAEAVGAHRLPVIDWASHASCSDAVVADGGGGRREGMYMSLILSRSHSTLSATPAPPQGIASTRPQNLSAVDEMEGGNRRRMGEVLIQARYLLPVLRRSCQIGSNRPSIPGTIMHLQ